MKWEAQGKNHWTYICDGINMRMILCKIWLKPYFENSTSIHPCCNKALKDTKTVALKDQILLAYLPTKQVALALCFTCFPKGF